MPEKIRAWCSTLNLRGYIALYEGDDAAASSLFREAMDLTGRIAPEDTLSLINCLQMLGVAETRSGQFERAEDHLQQALALSRSDLPGSAATRAAVLSALSRNSSAQGMYPEAKEYLRDAYDLLRATGSSDPGPLITCLEDRSEVDFKLGMYESSLELGEKALAWSRQFYGDRHPLTVSQIARLGDLQARAGRYDEAILYLSQAIALFEQIKGGSTWALGTLHQRLADAYREQGDLKHALEHARMGLSLAEASHGIDHPGNAVFEESLAKICLALGKDSLALSHARRACALYGSAGSPRSSDRARSYTMLASVYLKLGAYRWAAGLADSALEIHASSAVQVIPLVAEAWRIRGDALTGLQDPESARESYQHALSTLGLADTHHAGGADLWLDLYSGREAVQNLLGYARAGEQIFRRDPKAIRELKASYEACRQATEIVAGMRARYLSEQPRLDLAVYAEPAFKEALRLALRMHEVSGDAAYLGEAFSLAEASKAGSLIDAVVRSGAAHFSGIPAGLVEREKLLKRELFACDTELHARGGVLDAAPGAGSELLGRRFELQRELDQLLDSYAADYPEFSGLARRSRPTTSARAMEILDDRSALVEYCLLDNLLVTFVVTREKLTCATRPIPEDLKESVLRYCQSLRTFDVTSFGSRSRTLGSLLIDPIEEAIGGKERLLVVPCDYLWYLPFETLLSSDARSDRARDFTNLPYLLTRYEVTYLYSATFLRELQARPAKAEGSLSFAGFAPGFAEEPQLLYAQASLTADAGAQYGHSGSVGDSRRRGFGELPEAEHEVSSIAQAFLRRSHPGATYLGADASETSFRQHAPDFGYLHIASHSIVDENSAELTGVLFSQRRDSADDGVLHSGEMFDLDLTAELVVLSSCESGLGKVVPGEGLLAMTRGLFYSGAQNVMVSLWDVYDAHASELMVRFYPGILTGKSIASSLRAAKLGMIANSRTAFPGKWGGFVHMGMD